MSISALQEFIRIDRYSRYLPEKHRRETWVEQVDGVFDMHKKHLSLRGIEPTAELQEYLDKAKQGMLKKKILGSQRILQTKGDAALKHNARCYNCTGSYCDRVEFFNQCMYLLLCGSGVGFSVQKHHIANLPNLVSSIGEKKTFQIPDTIEGWADAVGVLMSSYHVNNDKELPFPEYSGFEVEFDYSLIRPRGSKLSWGPKAPGPDGLEKSLEKIREVLNRCVNNKQSKLRPIDAYDCTMHASDAVLSGGIRRSATWCGFSKDDEEMLHAKTGNWFIDNPQRARSNNSVVLLRDTTTFEEFNYIIQKTKECGEPGFFWVDDLDIVPNPCLEINWYCYLIDENGNKKSGFNCCNLCEINGKVIKSEEDFLSACEQAAILGTVQASYDVFKYLGKTTETLVRKEALLGVSITGMMDSPEILFDPKILRNGVNVIKETNDHVSKLLKINPAARLTCLKPAGTTSCLLGSSSGIHPHHAKRYFRRVQCSKLSLPLQYFKQHNPRAIEESVWSSNKSDEVITFLCEVPDGSKTKNQINALELLKYVQLVQQNWVIPGTMYDRGLHPKVNNNVSNTLHVKPEEWEEITKYIFDYKSDFTGVSLLSVSGDKDYVQAPFTAVLTPNEIVKKYGDASIFASGIITEALHAFGGNLWEACDAIVFSLTTELMNDPVKMNWINHARRFANRYFDSNLKEMTYCLKDVHNWKQWCDLKREYVDIDWSNFNEESDELNLESMAASGCAGGACEINL